MRMLSLVLSCAFLLGAIVPQGAIAANLTEKKVDEVFNRLQYSLNVEWDQKDQSMLDVIKKEFETNLIASEISHDEIQNFMENEFLSGEAKVEYIRMMNAVKTQNLSEQQASEVAMNFMLKNYKDGTHFYGKGGGGGHHGGNYKWILCAVVIVVVVKLCLKGSDGGDRDHDYNHGHGGHGWNNQPSYQY